MSLAFACHDSTAPPAGLRFASVSAGGVHTCAVTSAGNGYCWGGDAAGQLGHGDTAQELHPVPVAGSIRFSAVIAGQLIHTCGLAADGVVYCWGSNQYGQLGTGTRTQWHTPSPVLAPSGVHYATLTVGASHSCGVTAAGSAYCWGYNGLGQLGDGDSTFADTSQPTPVAGGVVFATVSAGGNHTCGLTAAGAAYCWGDNFFGELGTGDRASHLTPVAVSAGAVRFAWVGAGQSSTCALTATGAAYCWGDNFYGELGTGDSTNRVTPTPVVGGLTFTELTLGSVHSCGVSVGGAVYCWGDNSYGQVGDGTKTGRPSPTPVMGGLKFVKVSGGQAHSCGLTAAGAAYCWGDNSSGKLGDGTTNPRLAPVPVVP